MHASSTLTNVARGCEDSTPASHSATLISTGAHPWRALFAVAALALLAPTVIGQVLYTMKSLGTLEGGTNVHPTRINRHGEVAGFALSGSANDIRAFVYSRGRMKSIGTFGGQSLAFGINDHGEVVGTSYYVGAPDINRAFIYSRGRMRELGTLGGSQSIALAINNRGEVTGHSQIKGDTAWHAFIWSNGRMRDLGTLGFSSSVGYAINDAGEVTGNISNGREAHVFLYRGGIMTDLDALLSGYLNTGYALNLWGEVAGLSVHQSIRDSSLYSDGRKVLLPTLVPGGRNNNEARGH